MATIEPKFITVKSDRLVTAQDCINTIDRYHTLMREIIGGEFRVAEITTNPPTQNTADIYREELLKAATIAAIKLQKILES